MKLLAIVLSLLGLALLCTAVALAQWAYMRGGPAALLWSLFLDLPPSSKVLAIPLLIYAPIVLILGCAQLRKGGESGPSSTLLTLSVVPVGAGLMVAALQGLNVYIAVERTHTTNLRVIAPSVAEAVLLIALGLLAGAAAAIPNALLSARAVRLGAAQT